MAMANMNLIGVFVTKFCDGDGGDGGATKNIISPKFSNFGDIIIYEHKADTSLVCPNSRSALSRGHILRS